MTDLKYFKKQDISYWELRSDGSPYSNMYIDTMKFGYNVILYIGNDIKLVFDYSDKFIGIFDSDKGLISIDFKEFLKSFKSGSKFNLF